MARGYLLGEGLGQDGHQVLQRPLGVELAGVLRGATLLRSLVGGDGVRASQQIDSECGGEGVGLTSEASMARSISSSHTLDQNSMPCRATSSMSLFMASMVIWSRTQTL